MYIYIAPSCIVSSKYRVLIFSTYPKLSLTDKIIESCTQNKCCKPHNQVKTFFRTCLFKTLIIYMTDFTKAISCSETTHVSTKQILSIIFASFLYLTRKMPQKYTKFDFLKIIFYVFCCIYLCWMIEFQENQLIIPIYKKKLAQ